MNEIAAPVHDARVVRRRTVLGLLSGAVGFYGAVPQLLAADHGQPGERSDMQSEETGTPFSYELLVEDMRALAGRRHVAPASMPGVPRLGYDDWRKIRFRPDRARWSGESRFRIHAFHPGWLFNEPLTIYEVVGGRASRMVFSTEDFTYDGDAAAALTAPEGTLPGIAGFRLNYPLNRRDVHDEVVAFLGASYFRALGRGNGYGISARGLAINTAIDTREEFPKFTRFFLERGLPEQDDVTLYAALESESVTGAYKFVIRPGRVTEMDVTVHLFLRTDVAMLGVAPLTSMFLHDAKNNARFDDYRPRVHDSDGLLIRRGDGDILWRPLNNPPILANSYFGEVSPKSFGLYQRARDFADYQDAEARYDRRPSLDVVPLHDWGRGAVRLVEIPSDLEVNDNIVAFWVPEGPHRAGEERRFSYRLRWGDLAQNDQLLGRVRAMRAGVGGVSGTKPDAGTRKFVVDFDGAFLDVLDPDEAVVPVVFANGGAVVNLTLEKVAAGGVWRMVVDVAAADGATVELVAHLAMDDRKLTETWLYQWINL